MVEVAYVDMVAEDDSSGGSACASAGFWLSGWSAAENGEPVLIDHRYNMESGLCAKPVIELTDTFDRPTARHSGTAAR